MISFIEEEARRLSQHLIHARVWEPIACNVYVVNVYIFSKSCASRELLLIKVLSLCSRAKARFVVLLPRCSLMLALYSLVLALCFPVIALCFPLLSACFPCFLDAPFKAILLPFLNESDNH